MTGVPSNKKFTPTTAVYIFAVALVVFAAFLTFSLLHVAFTFSGAHGIVAATGSFLYSVYGVSSFLIPAFFFACAIVLIVPGLNFRTCFLLSASVIPFFTAYGGEKLIKNAASITGAAFLSRVIFAGLLISVILAVLTEYLLLFQLAGFVEKKLLPAIMRKRSRNSAENPTAREYRESPSPVYEDDSRRDDEAADDGENAEREESAAAREGDGITAEDDAHTEPDAENIGRHAAADATDTTDYMNSVGQTERPRPEEPEGDEEAEEIPETAWTALSEEEFNILTGESDIQDVPNDRNTAVEFSHEADVFESTWVKAENARDAENDRDSTDDPDEAGQDEADPRFYAEYQGYGISNAEEAATRDEPSRADFLPQRENRHDDGGDDEDSEIPPGIFDGYIAGHFSVIDDDSDVDGDTIDGYAPCGGPSEPLSAGTDGDVDGDAAAESGMTDANAEEAEEPQTTRTGALTDDDASAPVPPAAVPPAKRRFPRMYQIDCGILNSYPDGEYWVIDEHTHRAAAALKDTLNEFNIQADVTGIRKGPVITMFEILPAPGVKLSRIVGLQDNIALRLAASSVRIVAPIPGKHAVGIEVPNKKRAIVSFKELIETDNPASKKMGIPVMLGKDITGEAQIIDLTAMPHLLIAGSTGSGKSVCVNSIILSILYRRAPDEVKLLLIDPKVVELKLYNDIGHLLSPVITEPKRAFQALQYCLCEMERRYAVLDGMGVRNIKEYNKRIQERNIAAEKLPYIVVIIDEFADLMATTGKELESTVARLAAMSRAVGIHLVLATQRPSIDVITGLIKANIPSRIAFMVASKMDSRIIIDQVGAEKLLGRGDMLYSSVTDPFPVRIQGAFVSDEEVERVVEQVKSFGEPEYIDDEIFVDDDDASLEDSFFSEGEDPLYEKALDIVVGAGKASASYIQRRLKIGYNRAARLVEEMEMRGIVGPANGSKPREVIHIPERQVSGDD